MSSTGTLDRRFGRRIVRTIAIGWIVLTACTMSANAAAAAEPEKKDHAKAEKTAQAPAAIPLAQLAAEADAATISLRKMIADTATQKELGAIISALPAMSREIEMRGRENRSILARSQSLDVLRAMDSRWHDLRARLARWEEPLQSLIHDLDQQLKQLDTVEKTWRATATVAAEESAPPEVVTRIASLQAEVVSARKNVEAHRAAALRLQTRISDLELRVSEALDANRATRDAAVGRMFSRDSPPIWDSQLRTDAGARIAASTGETLEAQLVLLETYLAPYVGRIAFQAALLAGLAGLFYWARRCLSSLVALEPSLRRATAVVEHPIASALVVTLMLNHWIYPQAPRLLLAITGVAVLAPTIRMLRGLVVRELRVPLYAVLAFYLMDQLRAVSASIDIVPRLLLEAEMIAVAALLLWFRRTSSRARDRGATRDQHISIPVVAAVLGSALCAVTAFANAAGYVALSNMVGGAVLDSMYAGLVLYAVVRILDALVEIAMRVRPLNALNMVRTHRASLQRRTTLILQWGAAVVWVLYVLELLALREHAADALQAVLDAKLSIGEIEITLSAVLSFVLAVWAAFVVSRVVRFVLNEEVFRHASLKRGVPYAISRTIHFAIIAVGFFIAMGIIGMEMTQFTILASAFTIGVGFGLQNIFNNFVSGLIVLFERPVQVGDVIQIDDAVGVVERIGIRASVVRTASGSEIIVPNGKLISDRVVNWTLSRRRRVIELPVAVVMQTDPQKVIDILEGVAKQHPAVLTDPPVQAIMTRLGPDSMGFELRAAIEEVERWMNIRSELAVSAAAALRSADVTLR